MHTRIILKCPEAREQGEKRKMGIRSSVTLNSEHPFTLKPVNPENPHLSSVVSAPEELY